MTKKNKLVYSLAHHLRGDWFVNDLKQTPTSFYIHDRNGIYIIIDTNVYGEKNPIISINYTDSVSKRLYRVGKIGCSLSKSLSAIKSDIESRLFGYLPEAKSLMLKSIKKAVNAKCEREESANIIHALSCAFELEEQSRSYTGQAYDLVGTSIRANHQSGDSFDLKINGVNLEMLIKIAGIMKENNDKLMRG